MLVMTQPVSKSTSQETDVYCAVLDDDDIAVVRVVGRGTFQNSVPVKQLADLLQKGGHPRKFVLDVSQCETLDSTFLGVLA